MKIKLPKISPKSIGGKYWDGWMVIHVLIGLIIGLFFEMISDGLMVGFISTVLVIVLWQIVSDRHFKTRNTLESKIIDALLSVFSYAVFFALGSALPRYMSILVIAFGVIFIAIFDFDEWVGGAG